MKKLTHIFQSSKGAQALGLALFIALTFGAITVTPNVFEANLFSSKKDSFSQPHERPVAPAFDNTSFQNPFSSPPMGLTK